MAPDLMALEQTHVWARIPIKSYATTLRFLYFLATLRSVCFIYPYRIAIEMNCLL